MKNLITSSILLLICFCTSAQNVAISTDGSDANADAILHLKSTNKGLLVPSMTTFQRNSISNISNGLLVYDTQTNSFWYRDSGTWNELITEDDVDQSVVEDNDGNTKIQVEENTNENIIRFDINGTEQLVMRDNGNGLLLTEFQSGNNLVLGGGAGLNTNPSFPNGLSNTLIGFNAGSGNTSGSFNTYLGATAGSSNNDGFRNTFMGAQSGDSFTTGSDNCMLGMSAGGSHTSGNFNTYVGTAAGSNKTSGERNTFLGYRSGRLNTTGSSNVFIGYQAGSTVTSSNRLMIDNSSTSSPLIDGNFSSNELIVNGDLEVTDVLEISSSATSSPSKGFFYSNSGPLAYSTISSAGSITTDYGISSVSKTATGVYEITLDNEFTVNPAILVTPFSSTAGAAYTATYVAAYPDKITVHIINEAGNAEDQSFSMMVMGW